MTAPDPDLASPRRPALSLMAVGVRLGRFRVLEDVTLDVRPGEILGVVGANGAGKTTLIRAALGLQALTEGEACLAGRPVGSLSAAERAGLAGYLPQERQVGWNMPAWRVAALGAAARPPAVARRLALAALADLGAPALAERGVRDMSGGERARVLLARLFVTGAPLLVADEPAAGLDPDAQLLVMGLLRERAADGVSVLATLHDLTLAVGSCDRLAVLAGGRLRASGPAREVLTADVLADAFRLRGGVVETPAGPVVAVGRRAARPRRA